MLADSVGVLGAGLVVFSWGGGGGWVRVLVDLGG